MPHARIAWGLVAALACQPGVAATAQATCPLVKAADFEVHIDSSGAVLVPARVANQDVWFAFGAYGAFPSVRESSARQLGLEVKQIIEGTETGSRTRRAETHVTAGGKEMTRKVVLKPFVIGQLSLAGLEAISMPDSGEAPLIDGKPVIGTLGTNVFQLVDVELDLANSRIRLFKATDCDDPPVYWGGEFTVTEMRFDPAGAMYFTMELDGHKVSTGLLSGIRSARIDEGIARKYFGFDRTSPGVETAEAQETTRASYYAMSLTAAGVNVRNARVQIADSRVPRCGVTQSAQKDRSISYDTCSGVMPFVLGTDLLQRLRVYTAARQRKIYFTRSAGTQGNGKEAITTASPGAP